MDRNLSNIVLHPNMDVVAGVIDWEMTAFFPEGGKSIHRCSSAFLKFAPLPRCNRVALPLITVSL
ncbi:hypothetical protein F9C07_11926 [Aspergillus flavus]|uniref:Aminoglycoside phosphotransferase domain-containing protein n=1 Tax=Aspergillus flavus (strain ATCC 200026 / FGSC A1120 / IAM 13836 / NRRL 3357 / JCM 12722 / SRRC 167) TaxID=332952 RepID=A0A7U2N2I1_ASPFN|nr:hypothetical protein F9C07_11926 [Aspergillus flavus]